jgi:hypothetical protein
MIKGLPGSSHLEKHNLYEDGKKTREAVAKPQSRLFVILSGAKNIVYSISYRSFTSCRDEKNWFCNNLYGL